MTPRNFAEERAEQRTGQRTGRRAGERAGERGGERGGERRTQRGAAGSKRGAAGETPDSRGPKQRVVRNGGETVRAAPRPNLRPLPEPQQANRAGVNNPFAALADLITAPAVAAPPARTRAPRAARTPPIVADAPDA